jgi:acyl carrier protein
MALPMQAPDLEAVRQMFRHLLVQRGDLESFADDELLLSSGRLQSIDGVEVVVFLEEKFGLDFAKLGFDQATIDSVASIAQLVDRARG